MRSDAPDSGFSSTTLERGGESVVEGKKNGFEFSLTRARSLSEARESETDRGC